MGRFHSGGIGCKGPSQLGSLVHRQQGLRTFLEESDKIISVELVVATALWFGGHLASRLVAMD